MVLAAAIDVIEKLAFPIGIVIGVLAILAIPKLRKGIFDAFYSGHQAGAKFGKREINGADPDGMTPK
jgi:hypothetical protein